MTKTDYSVLIIEDDAYKCDNMKNALKNNGITTIVHKETAVDGLRYLKDEENTKPDLIILDMQFPMRHGDGPDRRCGLFVLEELNRLEYDIPVIMCSFGCYANEIPKHITNVIGYIVFDYCRDFTDHIAACLKKLEEKHDDER